MVRSKISTLCILLTALLGTSCGLPFAPYADLDTAVAGLMTPDDVLAYMMWHLPYEYHDGCVSYTPEEFLVVGKGDCKDYATFFSHILEEHGYYSEIVSFSYDLESEPWLGHVVTLFRDDDGLLWYQSNFDRFGPVETVRDVLESEKERLGATQIRMYAVNPAGSTYVCSSEGVYY